MFLNLVFFFFSFLTHKLDSIPGNKDSIVSGLRIDIGLPKSSQVFPGCIQSGKVLVAVPQFIFSFSHADGHLGCCLFLCSKKQCCEVACLEPALCTCVLSETVSRSRLCVLPAGCAQLALKVC